MNPTITLAAASEHAADLRRYAEDRRKASAASPQTDDESIVALRLAYAEDVGDVKRLADLDDAPALVEPAMLAIVDGQAVAALSLSDGRVVANPFVPTQKAVALLRLRAKQLSGERHHRWRPRILRPRTV
jgi:hypothetical protein